MDCLLTKKASTKKKRIMCIQGTSRERAQRPLRSGLSKAVKTWNQDVHVTPVYIAYIQTTFKATPLFLPVANFWTPFFLCFGSIFYLHQLAHL